MWTRDVSPIASMSLPERDMSDRIFLLGDTINKPHIRLDQGRDLVVSPRGSDPTRIGSVEFPTSPDGRQERAFELTAAQAGRLAFLLLAAFERDAE
jgi:hypothetical protein